MNEGAAEQRDEETVAARRLEAQDADARIAARRGIFPHRHQREQQGDGQEEQRVGNVQAIQPPEISGANQSRARP
jgi:hypothetical protein